MELYRRRMMMSAQGTPVPGVNYLISGSPTIVGNIMTLDGSATRTFIYTKERFTPGSSDWSIETKIRLHSPHTNYCDVIAAVTDNGERKYQITVEGSKSGSGLQFNTYASSNGTSWNLINAKASFAIGVTDVWRYVKLEKASGKLAAYQKSEGGSWATLGTSNYTYTGVDAKIAFGGGFANNCMNADIDLSETKIYIAGQLWWSAI